MLSLLVSPSLSSNQESSKSMSQGMHRNCLPCLILPLALKRSPVVYKKPALDPLLLFCIFLDIGRTKPLQQHPAVHRASFHLALMRKLMQRTNLILLTLSQRKQQQQISEKSELRATGVPFFQHPKEETKHSLPLCQIRTVISQLQFQITLSSFQLKIPG